MLVTRDMEKTMIQITTETRKKLGDKKRELQAKLGKDLTFDELIQELLK